MTVVGADGVHYRRAAAAWEARGRPPVSTSSRTSLVIETDRPVRGVNTGLLPVSERPRNPDVRPSNQGEYAMAVGQVLEDCDVYGRLYMPSGAKIKNVRVFGSPADASPGINSHKPLIRVPAGATDILIEDSLLQPSAANESDQVYGIKGNGGSVKVVRSVIARCVDTIQWWGSGTLTVEQSWLGDPYLRNPDRTRSDGQATHNDNPQLQGGGGIVVFQGNTLDMWISNFATWMANGNSPSMIDLLVTRDVGSAPHTFRFLGNWMRGGSYPINVSTPAAAVLSGGWVVAEFLRNRIEKGQVKDGSGDGWHAIAHTSNVQPHWTFPSTGPNANTDHTVSTDRTVWTSTGNPMRFRAG